MSTVRYSNLFQRVYLFCPFHQLPRKMSQFSKAFVKYVDAEDKLKINFTYGVREKNFTFMRPKEEKLQVTISRMKLKMQEALSKKVNKKRKKVTEEIEENKPEVEISLSKGLELINEDVKNVDAWTEDCQLKVNNSTYEIILNPPTVLSLTLPTNIMAGFPVYPKVELEFCSKDQCSYTWYRSISKSDSENLTDLNIHKVGDEHWVHLSDGFFYITNQSDIGCILKLCCVPKCESKVGCEETVVSSNPVEPGPGTCPFEKRHEFTKELAENGVIRCVSYNILADCYADTDTARNDLFPYCPSEYLSLDYRKQLYLKEIIGYNADIVCLQEVDRKVFHSDLTPVLTSTGLEGIYSEKGGPVIEGLSCFYRNSKFRLIETRAIILSVAVSTEPILKPILSKLEENEKLKDKFMSRTTALQVVLLEEKGSMIRYLVANTHLYFHPLADNIRILQAASILLYLENVMREYQGEFSNGYSTRLIISGDFNSSAGCGVDVLMTQGKLDEDCIDWHSNPEELVQPMPLSHVFKLDTACGRPEYTNYTEAFNGCLDYIFYDRILMEVGDVVPFPTHEEVTQHKAIPSKVFPSDHLALICTLVNK